MFHIYPCFYDTSFSAFVQSLFFKQALDNGKNIAGDRAEYDHNAVQRGTLQHEIFETKRTQVWNENDSLTIKVNCRGDASESDENILIPYALFATFEMAPEYNIDVYQTVVDKVRTQNIIITNAE